MNNTNFTPLIPTIIPDWDTPLTDQDLQAIQSIESAFLSPPLPPPPPPPPPSTTPTAIKSRKRDLPSSVRALCNPCSPSPSQGDVRMRYPPMKFGGRIMYSKTATEVEFAAQELLRRLHAKRAIMGQVAIGFDIEWKPTFRKGELPHKAAVMQICGDNECCYVMHIIHSGITKSLRLLLEDSTFIKVGAGIYNDCKKISKDYNVSVKAFEDLSYMANKKLDGKRCWGLSSLSEMLVCKELPKPKKIRLGNWEVHRLSDDQLQYAATDAFASWHLFQVLKTLTNKEAVHKSEVSVAASTV